jgi:hypothetical protein
MPTLRIGMSCAHVTNTATGSDEIVVAGGLSYDFINDLTAPQLPVESSAVEIFNLKTLEWRTAGKMFSQSDSFCTYNCLLLVLGQYCFDSIQRLMWFTSKGMGTKKNW